MKPVPYLNLSYSLLLSAILASLTIPASAQDMFPEGKGRDTVLFTCSRCHGIEYLPNVKLTADQWRNAVYDMVARGAVIEEQNLDTVEEYLINSFAIDKN